MIVETLKYRNYPGSIDQSGHAKPHPTLVNASVHVFLDNVRFVNGNTFENPSTPPIDIGSLIHAVTADGHGNPRNITTVSVRGQVSATDSFWHLQRYARFRYRALDDESAFSGLSATASGHELCRLLEREPGPSTLILIPGLDDYAPALDMAKRSRWRIETAMLDRQPPKTLTDVSHRYRIIDLSHLTLAPAGLQKSHHDQERGLLAR